jgi:hypothetical protein
MQRATGNGASIQSDGRNDDHHSIVSELASLIEHVQASIELLEAALARESTLGNQEASANVVILDDVTPRYVKANAALNACSAGLGVALHLLLDNKTSGHGTGELAGSDRRPVRLTSRA